MMRRTRRRSTPFGRRGARGAATAMVALALTLWWAATASAQLDPLLFVKRVPPNVIVILDTSIRMLEDGEGFYRDTNTYLVADDVTVATALGLDVTTATTYRRKYQNFDWDGVADDNKKYTATNILPVPDTSPDFAGFFAMTRFEIAKAAIATAVGENRDKVRWGLVKLRQDTPTWRVSPGCDKPVTVSAATLLAATDASPCNAPGPSKFVAYPPRVATPNYAQTTLGGGIVVAPAANSAATVLDKVRRPLLDSQGLIPASRGGQGYADRPLTFALADARKAAVDAMAADAAATRTCRNTVVVLVTGGKNSGDNSYLSSNDVATVASTFTAVSASGTTRRVPIHVVSVKPVAADEAELRAIAANSGGVYTKASSAADIAAAINYAVQEGFGRSENFEARIASEYQPVSPIIGTVNLVNARDIDNNALPNTNITANPGGQHLPQRSNVLLSSGFSLPGFGGVIRAFRVYKPEADSTKPTGWKFVNDGTQLWPDLDGRPALAGKARVPFDPNDRNIYTFIPDGSGGGSVVEFKAVNAPLLATHMNIDPALAATAIATLRAQPLGAIIGSTPALMDVPSLDPPPDDAYGRADAAASFAGTYKDRRAMIFFGANDGMIHAVDARTGYEVWGFIPYNLLPKLRTLLDGQPVEQFDYFVDSSPKIAEVKIGGVWRSMLIIGQGPGGTFYQAFDVSEAGMGVAPDQDGLATVHQLLDQFDTPNESIEFEWAFPNYSSFDPAYTATFTVADGTPGGRVKIYGDLKADAPLAEKTVGYTWSDPAVGALDAARTTTAVIVGSGYFPDIESLIPTRGADAPKAGSAMYLIDAGTGRLLGNASAASCASISSGSGSGSGCVQLPDAPGNGRKNALQADPTAAGENGSYVVNKAYIGDIDGSYWRFNFTAAGDMSAGRMVDTSQPIYASSALLFIGSTDVYMFFSTGSDLLASTAPGGTGTFKLFGLKDNYPANGATTKFAKNLQAVTSTNGLASGERPSTSPSVAGDIVFYTTTVESATAPCSDFTANLYALTFVGGAAYDANSNGRIDTNESTIVRSVAGRATAPFIVDQHLYFGTSRGSGSGDGSPGSFIEAFGDPEDFNNGVGQVGVRILSWREIR